MKLYRMDGVCPYCRGVWAECTCRHPEPPDNPSGGVLAAAVVFAIIALACAVKLIFG